MNRKLIADGYGLSLPCICQPTANYGGEMKTILAALCFAMLAAGPAKAAGTILDGTFNGTFTCAQYQGLTNALISFFVSGTRVKAILTIYWSKDSKYPFGTSLLSYSGSYNAAARTFALSGMQFLGVEPRGWTYDPTLNGSVSTDGTHVTVQGNAACSATTATRVSATSLLKR